MNIRKSRTKLIGVMYARLSRTFLFALSLLMAVALAAPAAASEAPVIPGVDRDFPNQEHEDEEGAAEEEHGEEEEAGGIATTQTNERAVEPMLIWTVAGILAGAVVLTALYMLKRRVGGFPENPDWVAPITIMYAREAPGGYGDEASHKEAHGDPHDAHH